MLKFGLLKNACEISKVQNKSCKLSLFFCIKSLSFLFKIEDKLNTQANLRI